MMLLLGSELSPKVPTVVCVVCCVVLGPIYGKKKKNNGLAQPATSPLASVSKRWVATDSYRIMNFTVLVVALFLLLRKPAANALSSRIKGIKEQLEDLEVKKAAAESELAMYVEKLAKLEGEADNIIEDYIRQGNDAKARILKEAETAAEKLEEQAKKNIEHEFEQAKNRLKEDVLEKAMARAEEIIKTKISTDDQERLVDEYLNKVVA